MKYAARLFVSAVGTLLVAGCAAPRVPVQQASDHLVCSTMFGSHVADADRRTAELERQRRGLDCGPYVRAMQADRAYNAASGALLMQQGAQMLRPQVPPGIGFAPPPVSCTTIPWGIGTRTVCN